MEVCSVNSKQVPAARSALSAFHTFHLAKNSPVRNPPIKGLSLGGGLCPDTGQPSLSPLTTPSACQLGCRLAGAPLPRAPCSAGFNCSPERVSAHMGNRRCAGAGTRPHLSTRRSPAASDLQGWAQCSPVDAQREEERPVTHGPHSTPRGPTPLSRTMALAEPPGWGLNLL